jgi:hypothetical protein
MKKSLLVTSGCSWTFGVGVGFRDGMTKGQYHQIAWDNDICNQLSFRGILSDKYGLDNINLAKGGDSNQRQFRLIKNFFASKETKSLLPEYEQVFVLHGITSTARNELYVVEKNEMISFKFDIQAEESWCKSWVKNFYDHKNELARLAEEMTFLNDYYRAIGVKNLWFDTFNHHDYPSNIDNLIEPDKNYRDMLSVMANRLGISNIDNKYHFSSWKVDTNRVDALIELGYLNPISTHPTQLGHELIAQVIDEFFGKLHVKTTI